jgi:hypothetical protein
VDWINLSEVGSYEHGNEYSGSIKGRVAGLLSDYQLLKKDSVRQSQSEQTIRNNHQKICMHPFRSHPVAFQSPRLIFPRV